MHIYTARMPEDHFQTAPNSPQHLCIAHSNLKIILPIAFVTGDRQAPSMPGPREPPRHALRLKLDDPAIIHSIYDLLPDFGLLVKLTGRPRKFMDVCEVRESFDALLSPGDTPNQPLLHTIFLDRVVQR